MSNNPMIRIVAPALLTVASAALILSGCQKDVTDALEKLAPLNPISQDLGADTWKTAVLASPSEVSLPAPTSVTSPEYLAEINQTRSLRNNLSPEQRAAIDHWGSGSILRWNQLLRELVAKHNLAPAPNADNTYTFPDANNPFQYPEFPFANPPYAARAYAYASVAHYDALVAAWHYKKTYNRPAAPTVDPSLNSLLPASDLPGYPCEDAVIAGASFVILRALFPADTTYINEKFAEAAYFKQWAGAAVNSDIVAGINLGKAVAQKVMARAKSDGMKNAVGNAAIWDSLEQSAVSRNEIAWESLDSPQRPPMLPVFGLVKPWLFQSALISSIRPAAPPSTKSAAFQDELNAVREMCDPKDRNKMRIVHFWADGTGTYTPPGHWNYLCSDLVYAASMSEVRAARTFALLGMSLMDAAITCWDTKYFYMYPRPCQIDTKIKTLTGLPNFPAYTSGHSTFSWAAATILGHLFPESRDNLNNMAEEASISRVYGGIHYPIDCSAGKQSGIQIGNFAIARAVNDGGE